MEEENKQTQIRKLKVKTLSNTIYEIEINANALIKDLKVEIEKASKVPVDRQRLVYLGKLLQDEKALSDYVDDDGIVIHLMAKMQNTQQNPQQQQPQTQSQDQTQSSQNQNQGQQSQNNQNSNGQNQNRNQSGGPQGLNNILNGLLGGIGGGSGNVIISGGNGGQIPDLQNLLGGILGGGGNNNQRRSNRNQQNPSTQNRQGDQQNQSQNQGQSQNQTQQTQNQNQNQNQNQHQHRHHQHQHQHNNPQFQERVRRTQQERLRRQHMFQDQREENTIYLTRRAQLPHSNLVMLNSLANTITNQNEQLEQQQNQNSRNCIQILGQFCKDYEKQNYRLHDKVNEISEQLIKEDQLNNQQQRQQLNAQLQNLGQAMKNISQISGQIGSYIENIRLGNQPGDFTIYEDTRNSNNFQGPPGPQGPFQGPPPIFRQIHQVFPRNNTNNNNQNHDNNNNSSNNQNQNENNQDNSDNQNGDNQTGNNNSTNNNRNNQNRRNRGNNNNINLNNLNLGDLGNLNLGDLNNLAQNIDVQVQGLGIGQDENGNITIMGMDSGEQNFGDGSNINNMINQIVGGLSGQLNQNSNTQNNNNAGNNNNNNDDENDGDFEDISDEDDEDQNQQNIDIQFEVEVTHDDENNNTTQNTNQNNQQQNQQMEEEQQQHQQEEQKVNTESNNQQQQPFNLAGLLSGLGGQQQQQGSSQQQGPNIMNLLGSLGLGGNQNQNQQQTNQNEQQRQQQQQQNQDQDQEQGQNQDKSEPQQQQQQQQQPNIMSLLGNLTGNQQGQQQSQQQPDLMGLLGSLNGGSQQQGQQGGGGIMGLLGSLGGGQIGDVMNQSLTEMFPEADGDNFLWTIFSLVKLKDIMQLMMTKNPSFLDEIHYQIKERLNLRLEDESKEQIAQNMSNSMASFFEFDENTVLEGFEPSSLAQEIMEKRFLEFLEAIDQDYPIKKGNKERKFSEEFTELFKLLIGELCVEISEGLEGGQNDFKKHLISKLQELVSTYVQDGMASMFMGMYSPQISNLIQISANYYTQSQIPKTQEQIESEQNQEEQEKLLLEEIERNASQDQLKFNNYQNTEFSEDYKMGDFNNQEKY